MLTTQNNAKAKNTPSVMLYVFGKMENYKKKAQQYVLSKKFFYYCKTTTVCTLLAAETRDERVARTGSKKTRPVSILRGLPSYWVSKI